MIAQFLRDLIDNSAVNMRDSMDRNSYEYYYVLCNGLLKAGYIESNGKIIKPARWLRRVR